ncbi:MAG: YabP/YqfC family sporulation protein [Clostridia bacterium]|nr:YabP/YqfC family sporulation protein [Clostridia bacterium]
MQRTLKNTIAVISKEEFSDYLLPHITFNACKEAIVEGSRGVLEYKSDTVRVNCGKYILKFKGDNLCIRAPDTQEVVVSGEIVAMEFLSC